MYIFINYHPELRVSYYNFLLYPYESNKIK